MSIQNTRTVIGLKDYDTSFLIMVVDEVKDKLEEIGTLTLDYEGNGVYYFLYTNVAGVDVYLRIDDDKLPVSIDEDYVIGSLEDKILQQSILDILTTNTERGPHDQHATVFGEDNSTTASVNEHKKDNDIIKSNDELSSLLNHDRLSTDKTETSKTEETSKEEARFVNMSLRINKKLVITAAAILTVAAVCVVICSRD